MNMWSVPSFAGDVEPVVETFLGALPHAGSADLPGVVVLGAGYGVLYPGDDPHAADSPAAIRRASRRLIPFLGHHDFDLDAPFGPGSRTLVDAGDITTLEHAGSENVLRIAKAVGRVVDGQGIPIVLGGDDSVPAAVLGGFRGCPITVLHLDAHLDFRDEVRGVRDGFSSGMRRATEMDWVRRVVHVGVRGVGSARPKEKEETLEAGNVIVTARELTRLGPSAVLDRLEDREPFVVSLDCDVLEPSEFPAVRARVPGGPTYREVLDLLADAIVRGSFRGIVVTEFAPSRDDGGRSAEIVARLVGQVITVFAAKESQPIG